MPITYSTRLQPVKNHEEVKRVYASTQSNKMMDLDQFAEHISDHNSVFSPDVVSGVAKKIVSCMKELLLMGYRIQLGDLGLFHLQIQNVGWQKLPDELSKFDPNMHIEKVNVRWQPSAKLQNMIDRSTFEYDVPRSVQADVRRAYKAGQDVSDLLQSTMPQEPSEGPGSSDSGGGDDLGQ